MTWPCAHCGLTCGDYAGGYGTIAGAQGTIRLCHPNDPSRPDCYVRTVTYGEELGLLIGANPKPPGIMCIGNPGGEAAWQEMVVLGEEIEGSRDAGPA